MDKEYEEALRKDLRDIREDVGGVVEALKDVAKGKAVSFRERVEESAHKGEARVEEAIEAVKKCGCKVHEELASAMKERPGLVLLAAVGAGAILGCLLRGRRH